MFERFFPDKYLDSAYVVNYEKLYQEGYRGILFDIDNTLVPHGAPADPEAVRLFQQLRDIGFSCCLVSNNRKKRVEPFAASVALSSLKWLPSRPEKAMKGPWRDLERTQGIRSLSETSFLPIYGGLRMLAFVIFW